MKNLLTLLLKFIQGPGTAAFLWTVVVLALVLRLSLVFANGLLNSIDMYEPMTIARNITQGHGYSMHWMYEPFDTARQDFVQHNPAPYYSAFMPPLVTYPYAAYISLFGMSDSALFALMLVQAFIGALLPLCIYFLARAFLPEGGARFAALLALFYLPAAGAVISFSGLAFYQIFLPICLLLSLRLLQEPNWQRALWCGLCFGVLSLMRSEFYYIALAAIGTAGIYALLRQRALLQATLLCLLAFVLSTGWWTYRNYTLFGQFVPVSSHPWREMWRGNNPYATGSGEGANGVRLWETKEHFPQIVRGLDSLPYTQSFELQADKVFQREVLRFWKEAPAQALWLGMKKSLMLWTIDMYYPKASSLAYLVPSAMVSLLCFWGIILLWRTREHRVALIVFMFFAFFYTLVFATTYILPRYQCFVYPPFFPLGGYALYYLTRKYSMLTQK